MLATLANLGEFIGGVAVLVTIVYFAVQLRANLRVNRAQALSSWTAAAQAEKEVLYRDADFRRLYREVVLEGNPPEGDEAIQFFAYCVQFMNTWQLAFIQQRQGIMSLNFLERVSIGYVAFAASQQARAWWSSGGSSMYDPEFVEFVNQRIEP